MGNRYSVSYSGQTKTCPRCDIEGHEARNCEAGRKSYSQAVEMNSAANSALEQLKNLIEEHEGKVSLVETDGEDTDPEGKLTTKERKQRKSQRTGKKSQEKIRNQKIMKNQTKFSKHGKNTKHFIV